jgi:hypothetical protein
MQRPSKTPWYIDFMKITDASSLTNDQLTAEVTRLARGEREATVALIVHLAEFGERGLHAAAGFASLFEYCTKVLHLSEDAAFNRVEAARAARRFPVMVDMLLKGSLSPTTARMLGRKLTPENHAELLAAASGKSKKEVEKVLAWRFPEPDVRSSVRKLPSPTIPVPGSPVPETAELNKGAPGNHLPGTGPGGEVPRPDVVRGDVPAGQVVLAVVPSPSPRPVVRPLAPERYEIRFTASEETRELLDLAQDMLGHAIPSGDLAQVFARSLRALVEDLARKKFAATQRPRNSRGQKDGSRNIPAAVQRIVFVRDRGRCAYVPPDGHRCGARRFVEFHHLAPHGAGGKPTVDNIQLRCGAHNRYEAELFYGPGKRRGGVDVVREVTAVPGWATEQPLMTEPIFRSGTVTISIRKRPETAGRRGVEGDARRSLT